MRETSLFILHAAVSRFAGVITFYFAALVAVVAILAFSILVLLLTTSPRVTETD